MTDTPEQIAAKLTEAQHDAWVRTVLMVLATEPQRRAFVSGYNGEQWPQPPGTKAKLQAHALGLQVRAILMSDAP